MTTIKTPRYVVWLNTDDSPEPVRHLVTVTVQDRLRAEQMGAQLGLPTINHAQQTHVALWCWAALRRTNVITAKAGDFLNKTLADFDQDEDTPADGDPVDPTQPGPGTD